LPAACCNGASFLGIVSATAAGDCGDVTEVSGTTTDLACGALYLGGGANGVPLPVALPDMARSVVALTSCAGQTATLGSTTSTQTGSDRSCTGADCFFGPPIAIPNAGSTPTSVCIVNVLSSPISGTIDCGTGAMDSILPLDGLVYLTGDTATDPMGTIAGLQPCPLCSAGTCIGGPNDGMACTPGSSALGNAYPTSQDCPPDPTYLTSVLSITLSPSTAVSTWKGTPATNDDGSAMNQSRVFSGFCMSANLKFANPPQQCWENGMAVGPACSGAFETCEQLSNGAFGPAGGAVLTISAVGVPAGPNFVSSGRLVSIFSIPPTFNGTVDSAADLPGPGAITSPANFGLCSSASACP
jgi:hypothetical protein